MEQNKEPRFSCTTAEALQERIAAVKEVVHDFTEFPPVPGPEGREAYGHVAFEGLFNTRDLGGLVGKDGRRVKPGLLLRSGTLGYFGTKADIASLREDYKLRLIVDFRNDTEASEIPDPLSELPQVRYLHRDILAEAVAGITQEQENDAFEVLRKELQGGDVREILKRLYPNLLLGKNGIEGYRAFLKALVACEEGAALWHCFAGRDRCGMASMLVESILGVAWEDIENDYLATNAYIPAEITRDSPASAMSINAAREAVEERYGSVMGYITEALGVTEEEIKQLQDRYLE